MKINRKFWLQTVLSGTVFYFIFMCPGASANGLAISNTALDSQSTSADTVTLQFDITWNNSWRDSINYDAAWLFVKYSTDSGTTWNHATLKTSGTNPSGFSQGSGTGVDIIVPQDKKGCFIQRSASGSGTLTTTDVEIVWDYAADGLTDATASAPSTIFKFFAMEMVYVAQGSFYIGDGTDGTNDELLWETSIPGTINSETEILKFGTARGTAGEFFDPTNPNFFTIGGGFPKGYAPFYMMKYEITEGQWVEFFNTLTTAQKTTRDLTSASGKNSDAVTSRNTVSWTSGDATTTRSDRACGYLSWMDVCAFLDWAALRPFTEFEYEKACRGPLYPVAGEYAWGTTSITASTTISGTEDGTETITTASANANYNHNGASADFTGGDADSGPLRAGIHATASTVTRQTAGASYWGILDLSGNVWERSVSINSDGRGFSGTHGDGILTTLSSYEGNATNADWPGMNTTSMARGITGATGSNRRGGGWTVATADLKYFHISSRNFGETTDTTRTQDFGGRGIRTAPV